jgi:hypothetical protein
MESRTDIPEHFRKQREGSISGTVKEQQDIGEYVAVVPVVKTSPGKPGAV